MGGRGIVATAGAPASAAALLLLGGAACWVSMLCRMDAER